MANVYFHIDSDFSKRNIPNERDKNESIVKLKNYHTNVVDFSKNVPKMKVSWQSIGIKAQKSSLKNLLNLASIQPYLLNI